MANGHPFGELNLTRAASVTGVPHIISTMASISFPELAAERDIRHEAGMGKATLWWQLYVMTDRKESERRILEAARAGCAAILITVDAPEIGNREADSRPPSSNMMDGELSLLVWRMTTEMLMPVLAANLTWYGFSPLLCLGCLCSL